MGTAEERLLEDPPLLQISELHTSDGSVDINNLPALKKCTGNWRACYIILGTEFCECMAFFSIGKNVVSYLTLVLHESNVTAAGNVSTWIGTCFVTPLVGAILADSCWGKYKTIVVFVSIYFAGMIVLTLSASLPMFDHASCPGLGCSEGFSAQHLLVYLGLYLVALGTGGIKPCAMSFGAEQFDDNDPLERSNKGSFFNWYYFCINIGSLIAGTVVVWLEDRVGWELGFLIPTVFMGLALGMFVMGSQFYRFQRAGGSPLTRVCQVIVAAMYKFNKHLPDDSSSLYELPGSTSAIEGTRELKHTAEFRFFDKAAIVSASDEKYITSRNPWRLSTVTEVEELKILLRMFSVGATLIFFYAVTAQMSSTFVEQGMVMDTHIGSFTIPPASLSTFDVISVLIWIPVYDKILVPIARKFTGKERGISQMQRLGSGLVISILVMIYAALVETRRLEMAEDLVRNKSVVSMSIFWQAPQYFFLGAGEVFTSVGSLEFFYDQAPASMRSVCMAFGLLMISLGNYLNSLILAIVALVTSGKGMPGWIPDNLNEGHLDRFFLLMAGLSSLNLMAFLYCSRRYKYQNT